MKNYKLRVLERKQITFFAAAINIFEINNERKINYSCTIIKEIERNAR